MNEETTIPAWRKAMRPLVYLACPYSHKDPAVREARFHAVTRYAARLTNEGLIVFSPITHSHPMHLIGLDGDWTFWERVDRVYLGLCHKIFVLKLPGWEESIGVTAEIKIAQESGMEIEYVEPFFDAVEEGWEAAP